MPEYIPLSDNKLSEIAENIYRRLAFGTVKVDNPTIVLIGGQPGAGKTAAAKAAENQLSTSGGLIHIDADEFHKRIPNNKYYNATQTHDDCKKIAMRVKELAIKNSRNVLEEGLFRKENDLTSRAEEAHKIGYKIEIIGVATSREVSRLCVLERREAFRDGRGYVRDVSESKQDQSYHGFTQNMISSTANFDRVRIINREGTLLYDSAGKGKYRSVIEAFEQGRKLTDQQIVDLNKRYDVLLKECTAKGIPDDQVARVHEARANFNAFTSAEKHLYGQRIAAQNGVALARDPRFIDHSDAELCKSAYYRGVCEKNQIFSGRTPNFSIIDTCLSNRVMLAKLPDVPGLETVKIERVGQSLSRDSGFER
jgi:chloramphenicol 3-O-phosphotransferase